MLRDRSVVITGASSGLGAALADHLAGLGARLALFSPEAERLAEVAARCRTAGARAIAVVGDVTRPDDCRRLVEEAAAAHGGIDVLVANAGISMWARFAESPDLAVFRKLVEVNYLGAVHCAHYALPHLVRSRGMLVAITSIQARVPAPLHTGYVASKHALQGFCDALRMEVADQGVGVLTVLPHWLRGTELRQHAFGPDGKPVGATSRKHSKESISVDDASRAIARAIDQRRRELVLPWKLKLLVALNALRPEWAEWIIRRKVGREDRGGPGRG